MRAAVLDLAADLHWPRVAAPGIAIPGGEDVWRLVVLTLKPESAERVLAELERTEAARFATSSCASSVSRQQSFKARAWHAGQLEVDA
jgi:hypothetical protein